MSTESRTRNMSQTARRPRCEAGKKTIFPAPARFGIRLILVVFCLAFAGAPASSLPIMGPDTEARIGSLLQGNSSEYPPTAGWELADWHFTDFDIFLHMEKPPDGAAMLRLSCTSLPSDAPFIGESRNFRMELVSHSGVDQKDADQAARAMLARIKHNDTTMFFDNPDMQGREGFNEYLFRKYFFLPLLAGGLLIAVGLLIACFRPIREHLLPGGLPAAAALLLLIVAAGAIRFADGPRAPVHNNGHGVRELRSIIHIGSPEEKEILYGRTYITLMRSGVGLAGGTDDSVFTINIILGTLAVLGMYILAKALLSSEAAALTAAAAACFSPGLVWLSASESPASMHLLFALPGLAFAALSAKTRNVPLMWLACIFVCLGSTVRLITMAIAPIAVIVFAYSYLSSPAPRGAGGGRMFRDHAFYCLGAMAVWITFHFLSLDPDNIGSGVARLSLSFYIHNMREFNILFDPTLSPPVLPYLALAGLIALAWKRPLLAAALAVSFLAAVPAAFTTMADRTDFLRYQPQTHWIYYLPAGALAGYLAQSRLPRLLAGAAALSVAAAIALSSVHGLSFLAAGNEEIAEYHFIKEVSSDLPESAGIVLPMRYAGVNRMVSEFPDYLGNFRLYGLDPKSMKSGDYYYIGLDCYRYDDEKDMTDNSADNGMRKRCASVPGIGAAPVAEVTLSADLPPGEFHKRYFLLGGKAPVIGFYAVPKPPDD